MMTKEGGKVSRLSEEEREREREREPSFPAANIFGRMAEKNIEKAKKATYKNFYLIGKELNELGINFNCAPSF